MTGPLPFEVGSTDAADEAAFKQAMAEDAAHLEPPPAFTTALSNVQFPTARGAVDD